jgi:microcin C transport system permease protein
LAAYILRRLLLIIPTMLGIMLVTFVIVQFAPGGPVERLIAQLTGTDAGATAKFSGGGSDFAGGGQQGMPGGDVSATSSKYRGRKGWTLSSSPASRSSSASTSRRTSASAR